MTQGNRENGTLSSDQSIDDYNHQPKPMGQRSGKRRNDERKDNFLIIP